MWGQGRGRHVATEPPYSLTSVAPGLDSRAWVVLSLGPVFCARPESGPCQVTPMAFSLRKP